MDRAGVDEGDSEIMRQTEQAFVRTEESLRQMPDLLRPGITEKVGIYPGMPMGSARMEEWAYPT